VGGWVGGWVGGGGGGGVCVCVCVGGGGVRAVHAERDVNIAACHVMLCTMKHRNQDLIGMQAGVQQVVVQALKTMLANTRTLLSQSIREAEEGGSSLTPVGAAVGSAVGTVGAGVNPGAAVGVVVGAAVGSAVGTVGAGVSPGAAVGFVVGATVGPVGYSVGEAVGASVCAAAYPMQQHIKTNAAAHAHTIIGLATVGLAISSSSSSSAPRSEDDGSGTDGSWRRTAGWYDCSRRSGGCRWWEVLLPGAVPGVRRDDSCYCNCSTLALATEEHPSAVTAAYESSITPHRGHRGPLTSALCVRVTRTVARTHKPCECPRPSFNSLESPPQT
jgi:hypothetical protein